MSESKGPISFERVPEVLLHVTEMILQNFESPEASPLRDGFGEVPEGGEWRLDAMAAAIAALRVTLSTYPKFSASGEALASAALNIFCERLPSTDSSRVKNFVLLRQEHYLGAFEMVMVTGSDAAVERAGATAARQGDVEVAQFVRVVTTKLSEYRKQLLEYGFKGGVSRDQTSPLELTSEAGSSLAVFMAAMTAVGSYHEMVSEIEPHVYGQ